MNQFDKFESIIDKLIYGFIIIFLLTLHNSIFLNQIGYYGALLLIFTKAFYLKKNPFNKTGLEWFFLLFIIAEVLSTIFSIDPANAFQNLLKRVLLIPIVYVIFFAADSKKKAATFFKVYIAAAFITLIIYLIFAYQHFIAQLYQLETRGPSPFQYVMTAGGLISFSVIFLFAFLINEKSGWKTSLLVLVAFLVSVIALAASYTRAAWIGAAVGIFIILILKRKWIIIFPAIVLTIVYLFTQKTSTTFIIHDYETGLIREQAEYNGKLLSVYSEGNNVLLSAYENGVVEYIDSLFIPVLKPQSPVTFFSKWKEDIYFAVLIDQRIEIYKRDNSRFQKVNEMISPGFTQAFVLSNNILYVADRDSGLSIFSDPLSPENLFRYPEFGKVMRMAVDSNYLVTYGFDSLLQVYTLKNGLPETKIFSKVFDTKFGFLTIVDSCILFSSNEDVMLFRMDNNSVVLKQVNTELKNIHTFTLSDSRLYAFGFSNRVYELNFPLENSLTIVDTGNIEFIPNNLLFSGDSLIYTHVQVSRLNSVFDPYHFTNIQRMYQWQAGLAIVKDNPFFGVGDIDMKQVYKKYMNYFEKEAFGHLHNNYIQLLAALGLFGFVIVMALLIKILVVHFRIYNSLRDQVFSGSYALGAFAVYVGFLISGLAEWNFGDHEIITMVWFFLGLNLAFFRNHSQFEKSLIKQEEIVG